jgi:putative FmdB family regulatory protein
MPIYEYECEACARRFEAIQKFSDPTIEVCSLCGKGPVRRLLSSPAIQFKGDGWYITDYARKGKTDGKSESSADKSKTATGDAAAKTESSDAKPATQKSESAAPASSTGSSKE